MERISNAAFNVLVSDGICITVWIVRIHCVIYCYVLSCVIKLVTYSACRPL